MTVYTKKIPDLEKEFETNIMTGLSEEEALIRLEKYGENKLKGKKKKSLLSKLLDELKEVMVIILLIAAAVSFALSIVEGHGNFIEPILILAIVIINAVLGVAQESSAERALEALEDMSAPFASVLRGGEIKKIEGAKLVPGDIILLEAGDYIPADARLFENASLKSEESALTGESVPVDKDINVEIQNNAPLGDRLNMVYSGCLITYGRGRAIVTSTAMETEMGKIADLIADAVDEQTPLQAKLAQMGKYLGILALAVCAVIFVIGIIQGGTSRENILTMFMTAVSLAVAAIPEGLPAIVTFVLALGVQRMVKHNAIIRSLPAVETLGSTSIICSDKTGTLTQNKMTVQKVWTVGGEVEEIDESTSDIAKKLLEFGALCNDGSVEYDEEGTEVHIGDPTETSIVAAAKKLGIEKKILDGQFPRIAEIPFDSERKLMSTVHTIDGRTTVIVKGGYDIMANLCGAHNFSVSDGVNETLARDALRVLAVGYKHLDEVKDSYTVDELECGLNFLGLIGMIDPPREESKHAIEVCKTAGIKTVMITGDHIITAAAIAKELGILENEDEAITGTQLSEISDEDLVDRVKDYSVYARVTPEDKIRIVRAWQANGEVVAMTGDGVNDAPALKAADIGCAMGITGTEVAKGAADMVLTDDNFTTIVSAVEEGRTIYDNIKKTVEFLLGSNIGEVLVVFFAMVFNWGVPLTAIQLLVVNVVTDAFPAFALGVEAPEPNIMLRKPVSRDEGIFAGGLGFKIVLQGIMVAILTLSAFYIGRFVPIMGGLPSEDIGRTMAFLTLTLVQLVHAFNCRTSESLFKVGFFSNKAMLKAVGVSLAITLSITLIPFLEKAFDMVNLNIAQWGIVVVLALSTIVIVEIGKAIKRSSNKNKTKQ